MGLLFALPGVWFSYSVRGGARVVASSPPSTPASAPARLLLLDEESMMDPYAYGTVQVTASLGLALFVAGVAYRALPLNLIPTFSRSWDTWTTRWLSPSPSRASHSCTSAGNTARDRNPPRWSSSRRWSRGYGTFSGRSFASRSSPLGTRRVLVSTARGARAPRASRSKRRDGDVENGGCIRGAGGRRGVPRESRGGISSHVSQVVVDDDASGGRGGSGKGERTVARMDGGRMCRVRVRAPRR